MRVKKECVEEQQYIFNLFIFKIFISILIIDVNICLSVIMGAGLLFFLYYYYFVVEYSLIL